MAEEGTDSAGMAEEGTDSAVMAEDGGGSAWVRPLNSMEVYMAAGARVGTLTTVQGARLASPAPLQEADLRAALRRWCRSVQVMRLT